jgi:hypothetical protein
MAVIRFPAVGDAEDVGLEEGRVAVELVFMLWW